MKPETKPPVTREAPKAADHTLAPVPPPPNPAPSRFPATADVLCVFAFLWADPEEDQ